MMHIEWLKHRWLHIYDTGDGLNAYLSKEQAEKLKNFLCKEKADDERDKVTGVV